MYRLSKDFIQTLEDTPTEEYHFEKALSHFAKKHSIVALKTENPTITLKYAWDLLAIKDYLLSNLPNSSISPKAFIAKDAVLSGNVMVEDDATIMEGVCIKGPAYIGKDVTIGNRAIVRGGVIVEENATIGSQLEIKNTVVMSNTTTHSGFIGDSIVGSDTKIAAGFITANARLDRQSVKTIVRGEKVDTGIRHFGTIVGNDNNIGIRVSTMPGVITGNHVIIGPSTTVMKNIPDKTKYYTRFQEVIEEDIDE
jgi:bifunctional UDP-N-acetylglucosamine pyrophosphorylase/glucosamine-1-phosphate N-acetyltransferase